MTKVRTQPLAQGVLKKWIETRMNLELAHTCPTSPGSLPCAQRSDQEIQEPFEPDEKKREWRIPVAGLGR